MSMAFRATKLDCYASAKRSPTDVTKGYGSKQGGYSLPPGDCKASGLIINPSPAFVKKGIEPIVRNMWREEKVVVPAGRTDSSPAARGMKPVEEEMFTLADP